MNKAAFEMAEALKGNAPERDTLMCRDYNVPIGATGICPACSIPHDMQSTYILKGGTPFPGAPRRALVVDDDEDMRECMAKMLENQGFEVSAEADGYMGFETWRESGPFLFVLTDFHFTPGRRVNIGLDKPIRHGGDLAREILRLDPTQNIAIMSGEHAAVAKAVEGAAVTILKKPFRLAELKAAIAKA